MKKILVPVDFSPIAYNAIHYALDISAILKSEIIFFHANKYAGSLELEQLQDSLATALHKKPAKTEFVTTDKLFNSQTIHDLFKNKIDLILLGTSGESAGVQKKLFGSNASEIIEGSKYPIMAIPPEFKFSGIKKIGYASDLIRLDEELSEIIPFARLFDAVIQVFHISPVFPDLGDVEKMDVEQVLIRLRQKHNYADIHYHVEKTSFDNQIIKGITSFLDSYHPDLVVLFHNHLSEIDQFLSSSISTKTISHIQVPVLIFPKA